MKKIGITGTIGAGKSTVSILLRRRGKPVFDCDQYSRILYQKTNPCYAKMVETFSEDILDEFGEIDRKKVAALVFNDEEKRKTLNILTHTPVVAAMKKFFENHEKDGLVFAEVPLLVESGLSDYFDEVILVTCEDETAIQRMMEDRDYTREEAQRRLRSQIPVEEQKKHATIVMDNNGSIKELDRKIAGLLKDLEKK
ncbi:MAG: dephospho-CoA kinase [Solobacterium sp.]|nr:dephospho-CoA kinase [Solobacterium sp.]